MELSRFSWKLRCTENWRDVLGQVQIGTSRPEILLLVSRLEPRKGQHEFLEAFLRIAANFDNVILVLAGEGPDHARIARRIRELGLNGRVVLTGFRADIHRLMAIADIGLLTSYREGLPRVLIQYALMRLPIVATDIPGVREVVTPEVTGLVVPTGNWAAMESAIARLLREPQTRVKLQENLARLNLDSWSVETMNDRLEQLYSQLSSGRMVS
jgi:glycosyltransferase involved in cell wall biosynthesis